MIFYFKKKIEAQIASVNIRIVVSANNPVRAKDILSEIDSAFNQFELATGNKIKFDIHEGSRANTFFNEYSFRSWNSKEEMPKYLDATDGLAVAVCHHFSNGIGEHNKSKSGNWESFLKTNPDRKLR